MNIKVAERDLNGFQRSENMEAVKHLIEKSQI